MTTNEHNQPSAAAAKTEAELKFEEQQQTRREKIKAFRKRLKWYHLLAAAVVLLIISLFIGWHFVPKKMMNIVVLDKTVLSYSEDEDIKKENIYRKHQGFFRLLNQGRYVKPNGSDYNYLTDYYGPVVDENGAYDRSVELNEAANKPDLVYISDAYGLGNDTFGHFNGGKPLNGGISSDDMSYISFAYESGAPIVAEAALFSTPLSDSVKSQLVSLLGVTPTKWIGRYIVDLQDFSDVPDWAPPMYEQQEGVEWRFSGPGILLISSDGEIKILEQNVDFNNKNLLKIYIKDKYKGEFGGCDQCNFYNWFELVEPNYGTEDIATFEFDLNATGMEKIRNISSTPRFCAITRRQEEGYAPVYYFAGDFCDYVNGNRFGAFLFSNEFFKLLSYDRQGDISNFYWRFYSPLMRKILDDARAEEYTEKTNNHAEVSRVNNGSFQVTENGKWKNLSLRAMAVNAQKPGEAKYSRDFTFYENLLRQAEELGVNCLTAKDLLPPEFYAAVSRHNKNNDSPIYIQQRILPPEGLSAADWLTEQGREEWESAITSAVMALHGNASSESTMGGKATYFVDVSACVLGVTVDPGLDNKTFESIKGLNAYSFSGEYVQQCSGARGFLAFLYETVQKVSKEHYGYYTPTAISVPMNLLQGLSFVKDKNAFTTDGIVSSDCEPYYYSDILIDSETAEQIDGKTVYDRYASLFAELQEQADPVLASGVTFSDVNAVYGQEAVTEKEQGPSLTDALRAAKDTDLLGAVLFDLNDTWGEVAAKMKKFSASADSAYLWHNTCDRAQRTGVLAMDSVPPENPGLVLSDADLVQAVSVSDDAGYVYLTIQLFEELDFKEQAMFVGLDTFQRNDGEYFYAKDFTATSLSGMEYSLRFDGKQKAALYVISSYDRVRGTAYTKESYTASYDKVADLTYGSFSAGDAQFYQTGSTVYVRLPWTWLNVADPSRMLVINDRDLKGDTAKTMTTNGMLVSVMVGERKTGDLFYGFPKEKHDPGYKTFVWKKWETAPFAVRQKDSFAALKKYWAAN